MDGCIAGCLINDDDISDTSDINTSEAERSAGVVSSRGGRSHDLTADGKRKLNGSGGSGVVRSLGILANGLTNLFSAESKHKRKGEPDDDDEAE